MLVKVKARRDIRIAREDGSSAKFKKDHLYPCNLLEYYAVLKDERNLGLILEIVEIEKEFEIIKED